MKSLKSKVCELLSLADVTVNGDRPWDIQVNDERFYRRVLAQGSLGLGEAYMDGWWNCKRLDEFFAKVTEAKLETKVNPASMILPALKARFLNMQTKRKSRKVVKTIYDLSNDFYMSFLDSYNQYTCGYFKNTNDLNKAQEQKLNLICKKLNLSSKDKVLDIGCGWGGFAKFAAKRYGCHVTGITLSDEQIKYAKEFCKGLPVTIVKADYRDFKGKFDKILICGMIEHVGYKNYRTIMRIVHKCLKKDGLFLLHTIGRSTSTTHLDPWTNKYIFPNGMLPSIKQLSQASERLFVMEDWHSFGAYYDKTLMSWFKNFHKHWPKFRSRYGDRFYRMWKYYLLSCAGAFRARDLQLWQVVLSKEGVPGGYQRIN